MSHDIILIFPEAEGLQVFGLHVGCNKNLKNRWRDRFLLNNFDW